MAGHLKIKVQLILDGDIAFGPGKADLLAAIHEHGSISAGGRALGLSYRRAWQMVDMLNRCFKKPLIESTLGGRRGGGAVVTPAGLEVLKRYRAFTKALSRVSKKSAKPLLAQLKNRSAVMR